MVDAPHRPRAGPTRR